jgi:sugar phosphate isomerase/epimerase
MGLALSTSWNAFRVNSGEELLNDILQTGFKELELSFNLTAAIVEDIDRLRAGSGIKIVSLHNVCPIPDHLTPRIALPDYYSLSSLNGEERQHAIRVTKRTIDTAKLLGARAVVLHCGRVEVPDATKQLIELCERGQQHTDRFIEVREEAIQERRSHAEPYLAHILRSLEELNTYARAQSILLGIENRFYYREIPSFEETGVILKTFPNSQIFYWHDTGHAQIMENVGFLRHQDYLSEYSHRLLGVHLHDILGCLDHRAPGQGTFDFKMLLPYIRTDTIKVIEAHHPATKQDIVTGKLFLEGEFHGKL